MIAQTFKMSVVGAGCNLWETHSSGQLLLKLFTTLNLVWGYLLIRFSKMYVHSNKAISRL